LPTNKCPLCESACIVKIVATQNEKYCEVDVCKMCGTMYPRGRDVVKVQAEPKAKKAKAPLKKPKKK